MKKADSANLNLKYLVKSLNIWRGGRVLLLKEKSKIVHISIGEFQSFFSIHSLLLY